MAETTKQLELRFRNSKENISRINVRYPKDDLSSEQVKTVLDTIVASDIFRKRNAVNPYKSALGAQYVTKTVEELYNAEEPVEEEAAEA